ncbi:unnamed protein product [Mytilus coruscus]|uniref:Uncharacterized protein n=1 Tax=Mytilus coruscus TaxID=42192 RepID=A0A6J8A5I0_MYTCO|nr:unnamed protein product [Mytilus coruscus]
MRLRKLLCQIVSTNVNTNSPVMSFAELKNEHCLNNEELIQTIQLHLNRKHDLKCGLIILLQPDTFASFLADNGKIARFRFLEEFQQTGLPERIIFAYRLPDLTTKPDVHIPETIPPCEECHINDNKPSAPLHWKNFNLLQEWSLDVPLSVQILLESFVNQKSLDRSSELENFVKTKLLKLYSLYDTLLNLTYRNYCGVLQDLNTQELAMNYQSVGTVFSISSSSGATFSFNSAEKKLKQKAADDICNYNTYIRRYPMKYQTLAGMRNNLVSLQECLIVVMMDNLVRLKYHSDPSPGENRSMQLCTLPITIKGVPINSLEIEEKWHDQNICDQSNCCPCKIDQILTKEDFNQRILSLLPEEESCFTRFRNMMTWTLFDVWRQIAEDDDEFLQLGGLERRVCENDTLERSFAELDIQPEDMGDIEIHEELVQETDSEGSGCSSSENDEDKTIDYEVCLSEDENSDEASKAEEIDIEEEIYLQNIFEDVEIKITSDKELDNLDSYFKPLDQSTDANTQDSVESENEDENVQSTDEVVTSRRSTINHDLVAVRFGFRQHQSPPMLTRHPPPATGRDDDIQKLREVLDDIMTKVNSNDAAQGGLKILFAPDNKIGSNLLKLFSSSKKYQNFLPEFPILHLRKSKITFVLLTGMQVL